MDEKKDPPAPEAVGGEVVSIDDARKRAEEKDKQPGAPAATASGDAFGNALQPIMAAIARELAGLAGPDGTVKLDGKSDDEATQAKTQALLRGLGQGLGEVLTQALSKWGGKLDFKMNTTPPTTAPTTPPGIQPTPIRSTPPPPGAEDPSKKKP